MQLIESLLSTRVTLSGIVTLVKDVHEQKAESPMLVTLSKSSRWSKMYTKRKRFGIVTLANARVTLSGIVTLVRDAGVMTHSQRVHRKRSAMLVTLSGIVTLVRDVQSEKAHFPMLVTLSGIVTLVRDEQPEKAESPMLVTLFGIA